MHRRRVGWVVATLAVVIALLVLVGWWRSDRRRINAQVSRVQKLVDKDRGESNLVALNKARQVSELFVDGFEFRAEQFSFVGRERRELIGAIHRYRSSSERIRMRVLDEDLYVDKSHGRATLNLTAEFTANYRGSLTRDGYRFQVNWVKREGEWLIDFVNLVEILDGSNRPWTP